MRKEIFFLVMALSLFSVLGTFAQSRWVHTYHENIDSPVHGVIESYDKGYLLLGKFGANYSKYNWLIKTDVNGEVLWEKTIGDGINPIALFGMEQDNSGNIYLCGNTLSYDPDGDPLVIKLDSCGNKQWCKDFYTANNYDVTRCLTLTPGGGVALVLGYTNPQPHKDRLCLAKLSADGDLLWKHCYTSVDTSQRDEEAKDIINTPDNGFLISGFCYYEDPVNPDEWWLKPYVLKLDSLGNFEWETVALKEAQLEGGIAWSIVLSPDNQCYYSSISHYDDAINSSSPALVKMDLTGNVKEVSDVVNGYIYGKLSYAQFISDSTLAAEAAWGNEENNVWSRAVIIDTLGHLLNNTVLLQNFYTSYLQVTYDGKLVYASEDYENGKFNCYLTKLNQDLEQDTIYTRPFNYDTLCPYQIVSDTIVQDDCGLIVGIEEDDRTVGLYDGKRCELEIWPNPAKEVLSFKVLGFSSGIDYSISIYDIFGRDVKKINVPDKQNEVQINVESFPSGVYIAILKKGVELLDRRKFVIAR